MRIKGKLKKQKLNSKIFKDLQKMEGKIKAGYPKENSKSHDTDQNGFSALYKANEINFSDKNFKPYLQISYGDNIIKYKKSFVRIAKLAHSKQDKKLNKVGEEMVKDIKSTLSDIQASPISNNKGCIYGSVTFSRVKK